MTESRILNILIPKNFVPVLEEYEERIGNYEPFKDAIQKKLNRNGTLDKRLSKNKLTSTKIRYAITIALKELRKQNLNEMK